MDGYRVMPIERAAKLGDVFITATGGINAIDGPHFGLMKNGAIVANSGHFNVELDIPALEEMSVKKRQVRPFVEEFTLKDGRRIYLLAEGRLINLSAAEGHPSSVMDMSFANQALSLEYLARNKDPLEPRVYPVPKNMDMEVGRLKLQSMGITIDTLSPEQQHYLQSWESGT